MYLRQSSSKTYRAAHLEELVRHNALHAQGVALGDGTKPLLRILHQQPGEERLARLVKHLGGEPRFLLQNRPEKSLS